MAKLTGSGANWPCGLSRKAGVHGDRARALTLLSAIPIIERDFSTGWSSNMAGQNVLELTDQNFEQEVLKSTQPVLVDFWAEWCMPCRMLAPTIEKIATDYVGKVKVGKIDTDANREVSIKSGISAIPTVILFKDGQVAQKFVGLRQERDFKAALDAV